MRTLGEVRRRLVAAARRHSRVRHEAEDIAHDIILAALRRGLPLAGDAFARTTDASARRHGAFVARTAARRSARELLGAAALEPTDAEEPADAERVPRASLPSSLQTTLLLLSLGLTKAELRFALRLTDAALRKRLQGLRDRAPLPRPRFAEQSATSPRLRRALVALLTHLASRLGSGGRGRAIAVSDCDGHGIIFSETLTDADITATPNA